MDTGLMLDGTEVNYRIIGPGLVLSDAIGADGQLLVDGRELTPEWAGKLRATKPLFAGLIDEFEQVSARWVRYSESGPCEHATCEHAVRVRESRAH